MTASLEEARAELVTDLEAGHFHVTENVDQRVNPPAVLISPGNPYLTPSTDSMERDELIVALDLFIVFKLAQRQAFTEAANRAVQDLLLAIDDRWTFIDASAPFRATNLNGLPVTRVRVRANVRITEGN